MKTGKSTYKMTVSWLLAFVLISISNSVFAQNQPPVADAGGDRSAYTNDWITLNGSAVDPDGDPIYSWYWEVVQMPTNGRYRLADQDTQNLMFLGYVAGDYVVSLTVSDGISLGVGLDYATVHVADNLPPVAVAKADKTTVAVGGTVCFDGSQSYDPEGGPLTYIWDFGDGSQPVFGQASVCHVFSNAGIFSSGVQVTDERGAYDFDFVTITVGSPVTLNFSGFHVIDAYVGTEGDQTATLAGTVSLGDPVSGSLTYDPSTGELTWLNINVNDVITYSGPPSGAYTSVQVFNNMPYDSFEAVTTHGNPLNNLTLPPGVTDNLSYMQAGISLYNNDGTLYSGTSLPTSLSLSDFDWGRVVIWTWFPDLNGDGVANTAWRIMADFYPSEHPPVLDPVGSSWVYEGSTLSFTVTATDPDGDPVSLSALNLPPGASFDGATGEFSWTPNNSQAGQYKVTFVATDGTLQDTEVSTITVYDGQGPVIKKKKVVRKKATEVAEKMVVEYARKELESTFDVKAGFENLVPKDADVTVTTFETCPNSPVGFQVGDSCFDISTAATFDSVEVCVTYDEKTVTSEKALKLVHYDGNQWVNITTSLDTVNNVICGESSTLSPFAIIKSVGDIVAPADPQPVDAAVNVSAEFIDQDPLTTHTATIDWGDGLVSNGAVQETGGFGAAGGSHMYSMPGVYTITLTVYDDLGVLLGESVYRYVVVYDPAAGFVTGGGWINSPEGAYAADPALTGKATFGFVSRYKKGANVPTGNTEFEFKVANLNFHSGTYDWLVIAGARAMFKGEGTINGMGSYGFILTAIDGALNGGGGADKFRIKIWDRTTDAVVYDNQMGSADDADPATILGGGSVVIHTK